MARFKRGDDVDQGLLLPPFPRDWLPQDHLVWFVQDALGSLDVGLLFDEYRVSGKGELAYDPLMLFRGCVNLRSREEDSVGAQSRPEGSS